MSTLAKLADGYRLMPGASVHPFDTGLPGSPILVTRNQRYFQVTGTRKAVLLHIVGEAMSDAAPNKVVAFEEPEAPESELRLALDELCDLALIAPPSDANDDAPSRNTVQRKTHRGYFLFTIPILPERLVRPFTSLLIPLFSPRLMWPLFAACAAIQLCAWVAMLGPLRERLVSFRGWEYGFLLVGNYLGLALHEVGHAAASLSCGVRHGPIGFGFYLLFPAFYTDVTAAWRLPRAKRMIVDAGGMYVSSLLSVLATTAYLATGQLVLGALAILFSATVWFSLLPFIRMDGYWLLSDGLGVPNLMAANGEVSRWLILGLMGRRVSTPSVMNLKLRWATWAYIGYYIFHVAFVAAVFRGLVWWYLPALITRVPQRVSAVVTAYHEGAIGRICTGVLGGVAAVLPAVLLSLWLIRLLRSLWSIIQENRTARVAGSQDMQAEKT